MRRMNVNENVRLFIALTQESPTMAYRPVRKSDKNLTLTQFADELGVADRTVRRWIAEGRLPVIRLSPRVIRIRRADADAFISAGAS